MPRNASGVYTLPLPPVVSNTVIESLWANSTMDDIAEALSDSLSRSTGVMTGPFRLIDGTVVQPGLGFLAEPSSGLFRQSSGVVGMTVLGVAKQTWNANGTTIVGDISYQGAVALPSTVTFPSTGLWLSGGTSQTGVSIGTKGPPVAALEVNYNVPAGVVSILVGNSANNVGGGISAAPASYSPAFLSNSLFITPGSLNSPLWLGTLNGPTSHVGFMINAVEKMRLTSEGNLGIGTPIPVNLANTTSVTINNSAASSFDLNIATVRFGRFMHRLPPTAWMWGLSQTSRSRSPRTTPSACGSCPRATSALACS